MRLPAVVIILAATCSSCASSTSGAPPITSPVTVVPTSPATSPTVSAGLSATTTTSPPSFSPVQAAFGTSSYQDSSGEHFLIAGTTTVVEFSVEGSRHIIGWTGGCNSLGTTYTISDGHLHLDNDIGSTTVLCDQALMDQDDLLSRVLKADPEVSISATSLRIADSLTTMTFAPTTKSAYDPQ